MSELAALAVTAVVLFLTYVVVVAVVRRDEPPKHVPKRRASRAERRARE